MVRVWPALHKLGFDLNTSSSFTYSFSKTICLSMSVLNLECFMDFFAVFRECWKEGF